MFRLYITFSFLISSLCAFAQWNSISSPTTLQLQSVYFPDATTGYAGGAGGTYKSTNGGNSWSKIIYPPGPDSLWYEGFNGQYIYSPNSSTIVIAGWNVFTNSETVIKSINGGSSWTKSYIGPANTGINALSFPTPSVGFTAGKSGRILKTTNGGNTWSLLSSGTTNDLDAIYFTDTDTGYAGGDQILLKTVNGGVTWTKVTIPDWITSLYFITPSVGYAGSSSGKIYKTTDYGQTWGVQFSDAIASIRNIKFVNDTIGYAAAGYSSGLLGTIYKTSTAGLYWEPQPSSNVGVARLGLFFINDSTGFTVGENGSIMKTNNYGGATIPHASFSSSHIAYCEDTVVTFTSNGPPNYTYYWLMNGVPFDTAYSTPYVFNPSSTYTLSMIALNGVGRDTATTIITTQSTLSFSLNSIITNDSICAGAASSIQVLSSVPGVVYKLRNGTTVIGNAQNGNGNTLTFSTGAASTTTTFNIQAVKSNTCGSNQMIQNHIVYVFPYANQSLPVSAYRDSICYNDSTYILVQNSEVTIQYQLRKGTTNVGAPQQGTGGPLYFPTGFLTANTTFNIQGKNFINCQNQLTKTITIKIRTLAVSFQPSLNYVIIGDSLSFVNSSNANSYIWNFDNGTSPSSSTSANPGYVTFNITGTNTVTLIGNTTVGCSDTDTVLVNVFHPVTLQGSFCNTSNWPIAGFCNESHILDTHVDRFGNCYVTGFNLIQSSWWNPYHFFIRKYDKNGNLMWQHVQSPSLYSGNGNPADFASTFATAVTTDMNGNVYVTGNFSAPKFTLGNVSISNLPNKYNKPFIAKLDSSGNTQWIVYGVHGDGGLLVGGTDIKTDVDNNIYVSLYRQQEVPTTFYFSDNTSIAAPPTGDIVIMKLRPNGTLIRLFSGGQSAYNGSKTIAIFNPSNSSHTTTKIAAISPKIYLSNRNEIYLSGTYKRYNGNYILGNTVFNSGTYHDAIGFVAKFDSVIGWISAFTTFRFENPDGDFLKPSAVDSSGDIYVALRSQGYSFPLPVLYIGNDTITIPSTASGNVIAKYSSAGNLLWYNFNQETDVTDMEISENQNIYFLGKYKNFAALNSQSLPPMGVYNSGESDVVLGEYDKNGNLLWANKIGTADYDIAYLMDKTNCDELFFTTKRFNISSCVGDFVLNHFSPSKSCLNNNTSAGFTQTHIGYTFYFANTSHNAVSCQWDFGDGATSTMQSPSHTYAIPGNYNVKLTVANGTCSDIISKNIFIPSAVSAAFNYSFLCIGDTVFFTNSSFNASSYKWYMNGNLVAVAFNMSYVFATQGTYTVSLIAIGTGSDTATAILNIVPVVANAGPASVSICIGNSVTLNGSGGVSYYWEPPVGLNYPHIYNPIATSSTTTSYTVFATSLAGCKASDSITVKVNSYPIASAGPDVTMCYPGIVQLNASGGSLYSWSPTSFLNNPNISNPVCNDTGSPISYVVTVSDSGCSDKDTIIVTPVYCTGMEYYQEESFNVFPSPTSGIIHLSYSLNITEMFVTDIIGQKIYHSYSIPIHESIIDLSFAPSGVYFLNVKTANGITAKKIIKE